MTQEEKAKAYDNIIEKAIKMHSENCEACQMCIEELIPELKESEDVKIIKEIKDFFSRIMLGQENFLREDYDWNAWIAWLEKQSEKTEPIENFDTEFERQISHLIASVINKEYEYTEAFVKWTSGALLNYAKHEIENQGEQKETLCDKCRKEQPSHSCQDITELGRCALEKQGEQKPTEDIDLLEFESYLCLMLQKFRTKGMCTNGEIIDFVKEHSQKLKDILAKPAWSEEDEKKINYLIALLQNNTMHNSALRMANEEIEAWLKSLRPQNRWKPSDLPHWKKNTLPNDNTTGFNSDYFCHKGYCINYKELFEKLPKDD